MMYIEIKENELTDLVSRVINKRFKGEKVDSANVKFEIVDGTVVAKVELGALVATETKSSE